MKNKTEIEPKHSETSGYSNDAERFEAYCSQCVSLVKMTTPRAAAALTPSTEREIYQLIEKCKIHFVETDRIVICLNSLAEFIDNS